MNTQTNEVTVETQEESRKLVKKANLCLLITVSVYLLVSLVAGVVSMVLGEQMPFFKSAVFQIVLIQTIMILPACFFLKKNKLGLKEFLRFKNMKPATWLLVVLFTVVSYPIVALMNYVSQLFAENMVQDTVVDLINGVPLPLVVVIIALLPCCVEEFIFRGVMYGAYQKQGKIKAMLLTAVLFGLFHLNINQMSYAIAMGILMVCLNEATGSILSSMLMHFLINGFSVVSSAYYIKKYGSLPDTEVTFQMPTLIALLVFSVISLVIAKFILDGIAKIEGRKTIWQSFQQPKEEKGKVLSASLVVVFVLCILFLVLSEVGTRMQSNMSEDSKVAIEKQLGE